MNSKTSIKNLFTIATKYQPISFKPFKILMMIALLSIVANVMSCTPRVITVTTESSSITDVSRREGDLMPFDGMAITFERYLWLLQCEDNQ